MIENVQYRVLGVMSGTSLDGVDLAICTFSKTDKWTFEIVKSETVKYSNLWKKNLKNEDGEYDLVYFVYPERKIYKLTKYKLQAVTNRLLNEKRYMSFLAGKIKRNKY